MYSVKEATTQKAKGLALLHDTYSKHYPAYPIEVLGIIRADPEQRGDITCLAGQLAQFKIFARPCPEQPRHGFVESRLVSSVSELTKVLDETFAADPKGEVMLMHFYQSSHSGILVPGLLTLGQGHDGATSGKNVVSIPLVSIDTYKEFHKEAGLAPGAVPYIEFVHGIDNNTKLTQLRGGPALSAPGAVDYVPDNFVVKAIMQPDSMDLIKWEDTCSFAAKGTVVHHPGGSLTDHYAVHARTFGIPVITSHQPKVGETLAKVDAPKLDPEWVLRGVYIGDHAELTVDDQGRAVVVSLLGLHNSANMGGEASKWIGIAATFMCRTGMMALQGESQYVQYFGKKNLGHAAAYSHWRNKSLTEINREIDIVTNAFRWQSPRVGGVAGDRWTHCGLALQPLLLSIRRLAKERSDEAVGALVRALNKAINMAHNGAWWMNKFCAIQAFNKVPECNLGYIGGAVPLLYSLGRSGVEDADYSKWTRRLMRWPDPTIATRSLIKPSAVISPEGLKLRWHLRRGENRVVDRFVPFSEIKSMALSEILQKGELRLVPTEDQRLSLLLESPVLGTVKLWTDRPLEEAKEIK